jgi:hypothetical protein
MNVTRYSPPPTECTPQVGVVVTVGGTDAEAIFEANILASTRDETASGVIDLIAIRNAPSQSRAANEGMDAVRADLVIFPHADVTFLPGWLDATLRLAATAPEPWGVLGPAGAAPDGTLYGTHSGLGMAGYEHVTAQCLDGSCLVLRKSSGLRFDENLTRFHGYDADICLEARARGLINYVINVPMIHNSKWNSTKGSGADDFWQAFQYIQKKWHDRGVNSIRTTYGTFGY